MTRRRYVGVVAGIAGLSGCVTEAPTSDEAGAYNEAVFEGVSADEPTYARWIPPAGPDWPRWWWAGNTARTLTERDRLPRERFVHLLGAGSPYFGYDTTEIHGTMLGFGHTEWHAIFLGEFDLARVDEVLRQCHLEPSREWDDATVYELPADDPLAGLPSPVVVSGQGIVVGRNPDAGWLERARTLVETAAGDSPRRSTVREPVEQFTADVQWPLSILTLREGTHSWIASRLPGSASEFLVGRGRDVVDGGLLDRYWIWPRRSGDRSPAALRRHLLESGLDHLEEQAEAVAMRPAGRATEVAIRTPIEEPGGGPVPPRFTLGVRTDGRETGLAHLAGDPIERSQLSLSGDVEDVDLGQGQVGPGETLTVDVTVSAGETLHVVYTVPDTDLQTTVATVERPE